MLILPIKKKWYDMILSGEKKEEYREIKPYYNSRFQKIFDMDSSFHPIGTDSHNIIFRNGYNSNSPYFIANCTLSIKEGKLEWGAEPKTKFYVLTIVEIL